MDKWIRLLFMILLIYNMLYDIILTLKQSGHSEFKDSKSRNSRTIADKAVMPLVLIMFIALILFVEFNRLVPRIIVVIITIPNHIAVYCWDNKSGGFHKIYSYG